MIKVETAMLKDLPYLANLEIKAQEFPLSPEEIKEATADLDKSIYVATLGKKIVGSMISKFDVDKKLVVIERISVHPEFRYVKVARNLLKKLSTVAWAADVNTLSIQVPEYRTHPDDDPDYLGHWLWKESFKASGKIAEKSYHRYGRDYDAYEFVRAL